MNEGHKTINKTSQEKFPELKNMDLHIKGSTKYLAHHDKISEHWDDPTHFREGGEHQIQNIRNWVILVFLKGIFSDRKQCKNCF